jgi:hypothetical protein
MFEDDIKKVQTSLSSVSSKVDKAQANAINRATRKALTLAVNGIKSQVNLKSTYIRTQLKVYQTATLKNPEAVLGAEKRGVLLDRFDGQQIVQRVKDRGRSKGDQLRGIASGYKSKGVTVKVKAKGGTKFMRGFYLPLKNGNGVNGMGIAIRTGRGKKAYEVLHGPSVSQVFQTVRNDIEPVARELAVQELLTELESI